MLERCLGVRRVRQIQRAVRHGTVTFMCLFLTVVVLRGTIGAGKFGTPEQDFNEIRDHLSYTRRRGEPHRVLEEASAQNDAGTAAASNADPNNYATFDISKILVDEGEDEKRDPSKPYTLGPRISDWDEQRWEWLKNNPGFPNFLAPNKPRVLLVTGSSPKPCENPVGDHYLLKSIKNKIDYCRLHGIEIFYNMALLDAEMAGFWAKLPLIRKLLLSHPEIEFLWWMDSDAMFTDMAFEVPWERYKDHNFVMHGWNEMIYDERNWIGLNTGSFLLRNCQWSLDILDAWAPMGPKGKIRDEAGKILTRELKGRPVFEADDQSAMVYLLMKERDKWGEKVYLESAYYLHGYWGILVDRYEEMIDNYHPGLGDHRWPLVTHFVGCKPCGKFGDYPVERCLKQMDRAFNFGDNQILQMYGFTHKSLASRKVKRVRNDTSNPLEVKDELGLLHPAFKAVKPHLLKLLSSFAAASSRLSLLSPPLVLSRSTSLSHCQPLSTSATLSFRLSFFFLSDSLSVISCDCRRRSSQNRWWWFCSCWGFRISSPAETEDLGWSSISASSSFVPMEGSVRQGKAIWDSEAVDLFCDLCIKEVEGGHRPGTHLDKVGWENVIRKFNEATKRVYTRQQLKNKWDALKNDWKLWKELVGKETGLGWNNKKNTIDA